MAFDQEQFKVYEAKDDFDRAYEHFRITHRDRLVENNKLYWGLGGQYPDFVKAQARAAGVQLPEINVTKDRMDGLRSSILATQYETLFEPFDSKLDSLNLRFRDMWHSDKDRGKWEMHENLCLRDGLNLVGFERMMIVKREGLDHITFEHDNPMIYVFDPEWASNFSEDMMKIFRVPYLTMEQIKRIWPAKAQEIEREYNWQKFTEKEYGDPSEGYPHKDLIEQKWGKAHQVIEKHYIEIVERWWEYNMRDGGIPFPETNEKNQSEKDRDKKKDYMMKNGLTDEDVKFIPEKKPVYKIFAFVPTLSDRLILEDKSSHIQIGRIPIFPWGAAKMGNQWAGQLDMIKDIQYNTNKYVSMMQQILDRSARGAMFVDPKMFDNNITLIQKAQNEWNNSAARIMTAPGASDGGGLKRYVEPFPSSNVPTDLFNFYNMMRDLANTFSLHTPTTEGRSEHSDESGKLYGMKWEAALITRSVLDLSWKQHKWDKADAYWKQAKITYSGQQRFFPGSDKIPGFSINEPAIREDIPVILNDISVLPRQRVTIKLSPKSLNVRQENRQMLMTMKQYTQDPLVQSMLEEHIFDTLEMEDEQREKYKKAFQLTQLNAVMMTLNSIRQNEFQKVQVEAALGQMLQQMLPQAQQQGGEGVPEQATPMTKEFTEEERVQGTPEEGQVGEGERPLGIPGGSTNLAERARSVSGQVLSIT